MSLGQMKAGSDLCLSLPLCVDASTMGSTVFFLDGEVDGGEYEGNLGEQWCHYDDWCDGEWDGFSSCSSNMMALAMMCAVSVWNDTVFFFLGSLESWKESNLGFSSSFAVVQA